MTATIHRWFMFLGAVGAGIGGVFSTPGVDVLGIPNEAGAVCTLISAFFIMLATAIRANFPDATTITKTTTTATDK